MSARTAFILRTSWVIVVSFAMSFLALALYAQRATISREEHQDLQRRVEQLETTQREQDASINRTVVRLDALSQRITEVETGQLGHEAISREVTRVATIVDHNQTVLEGLVLAMLVVLAEMVLRAFTGKHFGEILRQGKERGDGD